jgi:hypothetical protein
MANLEYIFLVDDAMSRDDANKIASAIDGSGQSDVLQYLLNVAECDGTPTEAKLAAIVRGLVLAVSKISERSGAQKGE